MKIRKHEDMLFALLRYAINGVEMQEDLFRDCSKKDWMLCHMLAVEQGVMAIAWDAVMALPAEMQPERGIKLKWALAVEKYSETYSRFCKAIKELSDFYASHGIATVQLKGVGLSTYYPVPQRRQGGDIDIYTYSMDKSRMTDAEANALADELMRQKGIKIDQHSYKHSNFFYKGISIENHKYFTNVEHYDASAEANRLLIDNFNPCTAVLDGKYEIMVPSPEFNGIFIIMHAMQHFTSGMTLHHLCDWACVLNRTGQDLATQISDTRFAAAVRAYTQLCRKYLGTDVPEEEGLGEIEDILLKEMLDPKYCAKNAPDGKVRILWYKTKRFIYSLKLRSMVFETSPVMEIWRSIVAHIVHPETIFVTGKN